MQLDPIPALMQEYDSQRRIFNDFRHHMCSIIETLLENHNVKYHSLRGRVKDWHSLKKKLQRDPTHYEKLCKVQDIIGLRIITYFEDDVAKVAQIIKQQFDVDEVNSGNKADLLDPDRFGYRSEHYIIRFSPVHLERSEYSAFAGLQAEVQIRSILQHAWAEIFHDLGYKSKEAVPRNFKRGFARLAGLFEIADDQFIQLRVGLEEYFEKAMQQINGNQEGMAIDQATLIAFIKNSEVVSRLCDRIADSLQIEHIEETDPESIGGLIKGLHYNKIFDISSLNKLLQENEEFIFKFAIERNKLIRQRQITRSAPVSYLDQYLVASEESVCRVKDYLYYLAPELESATYIAEETAEKTVEAYRKATGKIIP